MDVVVPRCVVVADGWNGTDYRRCCAVHSMSGYHEISWRDTPLLRCPATIEDIVK